MKLVIRRIPKIASYSTAALPLVISNCRTSRTTGNHIFKAETSFFFFWLLGEEEEASDKKLPENIYIYIFKCYSWSWIEILKSNGLFLIQTQGIKLNKQVQI